MNELKVIGREHIGHIEFTGIEGGFGKDKKAMLVKDIALIHGQPLKEINRRINDNRNRFKDGIDIIDFLSGSEPLRKFAEENGLIGSNRTEHVYLLSERGYSKLLKILEDDKAWEVYDQLVDNYFNMRAAVNENKPEMLEGKHLAIMEEKSKTAKGNLLYRLAMKASTPEQRDVLMAEAMSTVIGHQVLPIMRQKEYSATEVGKMYGITSNKVGRISNDLGLKAEKPGRNEYGRWAMTNANGERPTWLYFEKGAKAVGKNVKGMTV